MTDREGVLHVSHEAVGQLRDVRQPGQAAAGQPHKDTKRLYLQMFGRGVKEDVSKMKNASSRC